ncbi:uncharacterized protein LOC129721179 [Wyeomyia smithii]|uniref:uncharacterized protein LOC129721179 n=2 Tax=Wyeomyia smithii TaxID=174621 RepID=UPI002467C233|nr:uncharacterized protein LOC129721179 [Wyeomyia smithii]
MLEFSIALASCKNKAPGPDRIKFNLMKNLPDSAKIRFLKLFNKLIRNNVIPKAWRQVKIIAIKKPDKPAADHRSYRPIAMLSCIRKLLEKMILRRLDNWAETTNQLSETQFGFRRGKGPNDCLALLATEAEMALGSKQQMTSVFLDITGAFDSVSIEILSEKLHQRGFSPILTNFLINLLSEKHLLFNHGSSTITRTSYMGLPQGSCLSPLLYNFYISDIDTCLTDGCTMRQLADDCVVSVTASLAVDMKNSLQNTLDNLTSWASCLGIEFSLEKTEMVVFSKKRPPPRLELVLSGRPITQSPSFKYLGVWYDSKCTWEKHINYLKQRCQPRINFLRMVTGTSWGAHPEDLIRLYQTTILPVIEYGSICFRGVAASHMLKLERIQYRCLRIALGCMQSTHTMSLEVIAGILPLKERLFELAFRFLIRSEIANPMLIANYEKCLEVVQKPCMSVYQRFMSMEINPSVVAPSREISTSLNNSSVVFDLTMKQEIHGIPDHLKPTVVPSIFSAKFGHLPKQNSFFTDGSVMDGHSGYGVFNTDHRISRKLAQPCSIYVAELAAIHNSLRIIELKTPDNYFIFSDSLSSIEALRSIKPVKHPSYFLPEIRRILEVLVDRSFIICFVWVPSHCSIPGNEEADLLAKRGAIDGDIFDRPITYTEYFHLPRQLALENWQEKWNKDDLGRWMHSISPKVSTKAWFKGLDLTRDFIRVISRLMSNHYVANAHLYRINLVDSNLCECGGYEDIDHIVFVCPKYHRARAKLIDSLRKQEVTFTMQVRDVLASRNPALKHESSLLFERHDPPNLDFDFKEIRNHHPQRIVVRISI